jgi:N-acetylglucosamine malate deacetylase 2
LLRRLEPGHLHTPVPPFTRDLLPAHPRVLLAVAHPDDEFYCSGALCEWVSQGAILEVICLTRGEGGPTGDRSRAELGQVRQAEMEKSCAVLGARAVQFLDYVDPLAKEFRVYAPDVSVEELSVRLVEAFTKFKPDLVITHGSCGEYWHPAHLLMHRSVMAAARTLQGQGVPFHLATFHAWQEGHALEGMLNVDDQPNYLLDVSRWKKQRMDSLEAHASQLKWFASTTDLSVEKLMDITRLEAMKFWTLENRPEN